MDGCPRQNPAYRPATEKPRSRGAFLCPRMKRLFPMRSAATRRSSERRASSPRPRPADAGGGASTILRAVSGHPQRIALSEVIGGLSYALDLTEGEPPGHAVRSCLIGMRLAQELGLDAATRSHLFYALLLKDAGCSANSARMAALFGADDHVAKRTSKRVNWAGKLPAFVWAVRTVAPRGSRPRALDRLLAIKDEGAGHARADAGALRPRRGDRLPARLRGRDGRGDPRARRALGRLRPAARAARRGDPAAGAHPVPRADGGDLPRRRRRRGGLAGGQAAQRRMVRPGAGRGVLRAIRDDAPFWRSLAEADVSAWEPRDRLLSPTTRRLDRIAYAFAGVIDAKSPWTYRHSDRALA